MNDIPGVAFDATLDYGDDPRWKARATQIVPVIARDHSLREEWRQFRLIVRHAHAGQVLLLDSTSGRIKPDLLACIVLGFAPRRRRPSAVVLEGCMWERDSGLKGAVQKVLIRLANRSVTRYAVQSTEELELFPATWGVERAKMRYQPYFVTFTDADLVDPAPTPADYVFAGGNSHRDYDTLLEVARRLPQRHFVFATNLLADRSDLPPNVEAGPVPHADFVRQMRAARCVVTPIKAGLNRSTGHQTYLNAMYLGIPSIVTDAYGVADHVVDRETAVVVDGSVQSYVDAIEWVFDPACAGEVAALAERGRRAATEEFTFTAHVTAMLAVIDDAAAAAHVTSP